MRFRVAVAYAKLSGSSSYPDISGKVYFMRAQGGTVVAAEVWNVTDEAGKPAQGFKGFHIHEGSACSGNDKDPFADTGAHYSKAKVLHPDHAGDLPPLLFSDGFAWMQVYTGRFMPEDVIGKTVVLHGMPDDFHTQPSGDSGMKIACGEIVPWRPPIMG